MSRSTQSGAESPIRLTPAYFHILLSVAKEAKHGYAIMQDVQERTGEAVKLGPGSLYWAIKRLVEVGLMQETSRGRPRDQRVRRFYELTPFGSEVLEREVRVLADIVGYAETQKIIRRTRTV